MRIICSPSNFDFSAEAADLSVVLYERSDDDSIGSAGAAIKEAILKKKLKPDDRAWDFLTIALSVMAADLAGHRNKSSDGWTREFELSIAVIDPTFWNSQIALLEEMLWFLTNDRWRFSFRENGDRLEISDPSYPERENCALLLSGGLDSFVGLLDLAAEGKQPLIVSQAVRGDSEKQRDFARLPGNASHLQLNHNANVPDAEEPPSQRGRSIAFFAYGVIAATSLAAYSTSDDIILYVCENGFITVNPPLTDIRIGSLSTRTCHPVLISLLQRILDNAGLRVRIVDPYRFKTKGEMLSECSDQKTLRDNAHKTTSCGRFGRYGYKHCGKCVPCLIRRAAFRGWGVADQTEYVFSDLAMANSDPERFDDVRAAALALAVIDADGFNRWLGATLTSPLISNKDQVRAVIDRGLAELSSLLNQFGVK